MLQYLHSLHAVLGRTINTVGFIFGSEYNTKLSTLNDVYFNFMNQEYMYTKKSVNGEYSITQTSQNTKNNNALLS